MKGVRIGVERHRDDRALKPRDPGRREMTDRRERKSLRIGVHHADAVVWGPV